MLSREPGQTKTGRWELRGGDRRMRMRDRVSEKNSKDTRRERKEWRGIRSRCGEKGMDV